jgi:hypothetical protein
MRVITTVLRGVMKRWIFIVIFVLLTTTIIPTTGCSSRAIAAEVAQSIMQMNRGAVDNIDSEIATIDRQLYNAEERILKLDQVLSPAFKWVDYQKSLSRPGKWDVKVLQSGLAQLQNDQFEVTSLEAVITRDSLSVTDCSYTIKVHDFVTDQTEDWNILQDSLISSKDTLEQNREAMVEARDLSIATVNNILKYVNDWKIKKVSDANYNISGPGLGWSEQLTDGSWMYNRDEGALVPNDKPAEDLNTIILIKLSPGE